VIIAGDEVWKSSAQGELLALAERLGVPVSATPSGLDFNAFEDFPTQHALRLDKWQSSGYAQGGIDLVLFVGARDEGKAGIPSAPELPPGARIVRLGMDTASHGRNYGTDEALVGDVRAGLTDLRAAVESLVTQERRAAIAGERTEEITRATRGRGAENEKAVAATLGKSPVHPHEVGRILAETVDRNAIIVSENLCGKYDSFRFGFREDEHMWLGTSGVALGWSIGAATGAKLAAPDRQVVCCVGDGSAMYSAAGFWSQARYRVPVLTVVWNNRSYQFVRWLYHRYGGKMAASAKYPAVYLGDPDIDFVKLAGSQGVAGERVDSGRALRAAMKRGLAATSGGAPYLIEVVVAPYGDGADSKWHGSYDLSARAKRRS
jgi:benzoylformate decarboxylase